MCHNLWLYGTIQMSGCQVSKKMNIEYTWNFDATLGKEKTYFKPSKWSRKKTNDICDMICIDKNRMTETFFLLIQMKF